VTRAAYAEAFGAVAGRPLVQLPQMPGRSESEIFFDALALNGVDVGAGGTADRLLEPFSAALAAAMRDRREDLVTQGQLLPGAAEAMATVAKLDGVVTSVLTGGSKANAVLKLCAFGLDGYVDFEIGGYGSEAYPKGTLLRVARLRAAEKHGVTFEDHATVYIADSPRDVDAAGIGGARSLAVASGRATVAELREAGADAVLPDLTDTATLAALVMSLTVPSPNLRPRALRQQWEGCCLTCRGGTMLRAWERATPTWSAGATAGCSGNPMTRRSGTPGSAISCAGSRPNAGCATTDTRTCGDGRWPSPGSSGLASGSTSMCSATQVPVRCWRGRRCRRCAGSPVPRSTTRVTR
jgi:phosphoglycolate phosphatase-like HAD superfamily hydrolase